MSGNCLSGVSEAAETNPTVNMPPKKTIGSLCIVKKLWDGGRDIYGYIKWLNEPPFEGEDLGACEESLRCAIMLRYTKTQTRNKQDLQDIIIRSKEMRKLLEPCIPGLADFYSDQEKGLLFQAPFPELFFNWDQIERALTQEIDSAIVNVHASLLHTTLKKVMDEQFKRHSELTAAGEITFDLIWTLFKPGVDVLGTLHGDTIMAKSTGAVLQSPQAPGQKPYYAVGMNYIEWDGKDFGWKAHTCNIMHFEKRKKITQLAASPVSFCEDESHTISTLSRRGRVFGQLASTQPCMRSSDSNYDLENDSGQAWFQPRRSVKVSERIILDTAAWIQYDNSISLQIITAIMKPLDMTAALDSTECEAKNREIFAYCSPFLYGYGLSTKQWIRFPALSINDVVWDTTAWSSLVLAEDYKNLAYAFTKAQLEGKQEFDDFITGKCQGMVILLAGPPGTGKTLTAESLAEETRRPLYSVSAVELGGTATEVESGLSLAFDLAARWNAIILLDEADVFLTERSDKHLSRNSVVAVFLRKLEYFRGMVFLTTNRAHGFDRAFESRIHITIQYQDLSLAARKDVWKRFLKNAEETAEYGVEVSDADMDELAALLLNGRYIRNMVKSALLLAWSAKEPVRKRHIDVVRRIKQIPLVQ